jgi:hypothetical protein
MPLSEMDWTNYSAAIASSDLSARLQVELSTQNEPLRQLYVIPAEITKNIGWLGKDKYEFEQRDLNQILGEYGMRFIARELASELAVRQSLIKSNRHEDRPFYIGVGSGSTVFHLVNAFKSSALHGPTKVVPLVVGPSPESMHSAGFIAQLFAQRLQECETESEKVVHSYDRVTKLSISSKDATGKQAIQMTLHPKQEYFREDNPFIDWIVTGVGAWGHGQCYEHAKLFGFTPACGAVGDICSRFFNSEGIEVPDTTAFNNVISFATLEDLRKLSKQRGKGKRVIVIAGGEHKFEALRQLLFSRARPFNTLITDELMVRRLIAELHSPRLPQGRPIKK